MHGYVLDNARLLGNDISPNSDIKYGDRQCACTMADRKIEQ